MTHNEGVVFDKTPRVDAVADYMEGWGVPLDFAEQLERELAEANRRLSDGMRVPPDWKLVPVEPTEAMLEQAAFYRHECSGLNRPMQTSLLWAQMLRAAPEAPK